MTWGDTAPLLKCYWAPVLSSPKLGYHISDELCKACMRHRFMFTTHKKKCCQSVMETRGSTTLNCTFINLSDLYLKTTKRKETRICG